MSNDTKPEHEGKSLEEQLREMLGKANLSMFMSRPDADAESAEPEDKAESCLSLRHLQASNQSQLREPQQFPMFEQIFSYLLPLISVQV